MAIEDFTTYTEFPAERFTIDANTVSWVDLGRDEDAYVYYDKGVNHFDGDFEHKFEIQISAHDNYMLGYYWGLTNAVDDVKGLVDASADLLVLGLYGNDTPEDHLFIVIYENGAVADDDIWTGAALETTYYIRMKRTDATNTLVAYIATTNYDDEGGDLVATLTAVGSEQNDFRYVFGVNSYNNETVNQVCNGFIENLDLQEEPSGIPILRRRIEAA